MREELENRVVMEYEEPEEFWIGDLRCCMCGEIILPETEIYEGDLYYQFYEDTVCEKCLLDYAHQHRTTYKKLRRLE